MVAHSGQVLEDQGPVAMGYGFFMRWALEAVWMVFVRTFKMVRMRPHEQDGEDHIALLY